MNVAGKKNKEEREEHVVKKNKDRNRENQIRERSKRRSRVLPGKALKATLLNGTHFLLTFHRPLLRPYVDLSRVLPFLVSLHFFLLFVLSHFYSPLFLNYTFAPRRNTFHRERFFCLFFFFFFCASFLCVPFAFTHWYLLWRNKSR